MKSETKDFLMFALGVVIAIGFFAVLFIMFYVEIPKGNKEIGYIIIGALIAQFGAVVNYFYGSSKSSADKNEMLKGVQQ